MFGQLQPVTHVLLCKWHSAVVLLSSAHTTLLTAEFFKCNPKNSQWLNRDRFVLSNGHACALQYVFLHLLGYKVSLDDLKAVSANREKL